MSRSSSHSSVRKLWQAATDLQSGMSPQGLYWLLRGSLVTRSREPGGFLLPTVTLMLLVLSLVVGTLVFRTFNRTAEVIGQRQQRALYNAATPAIDRAKLKLEYLFTEAAIATPPSDADLVEELNNRSLYDLKQQGETSAETRLDLNGDGTVDSAWSYTTDVDGDGDQELVAYSILTQANYVEPVADTLFEDGDGLPKTVGLEDEDVDKAKALVVRNGPINLQDRGADCSNVAESPYAAWESVTSSDLRKAIQVHAVVLDLNDAQDGVDNAVTATLEMQQDRQSDLGNRWGAWFRYDLELHPGPAFNWNGAMHTEGSFLMFDTPNLFLVSSPKSCIYNRSASELSMAELDDRDGDGNSDFQGQFLLGKTEADTAGSSVIVDAYVPAPGKSGSGENRVTITSGGGTGSIEDSVDNSTGKNLPSEVVMNPIVLFTEDVSEARWGAVDHSDARKATLNPAWFGNPLPKPLDDSLGTYNQRLFNSSTDIPFVDDTYRADNRIGPAASYGRSSEATDCGKEFCVTATSMGNATADLDLVELDPLASDPPNETNYGYDGYWERRARRTGVRIIVGQRLELGNANEWFYEDLDGDGVLDATLSEATDNRDYNGDGDKTDTFAPLSEATDNRDYNGDGDKTDTVSEDQNGNKLLDIDPLYPPPANAYSGTNMASRANEMRQWRTLRDNLAAAQATAVYHYRSAQGYDYPVACLATTAHPGTQVTDLNSRTFTAVDTDGVGGVDSINTNFFTGEGTNGLEFSAPFGGDASVFETQIDNHFDGNSNTITPLGVALENLAYFAGDPEGAFPPTQDDNTGVVHPYPDLTMWGNFSELRRVITTLDNNSTAYADLSPADKSTLHTAACQIGMLSYSLDVNRKLFESELEAQLLVMLDQGTDILGTGVNGDNDGSYDDEISSLITSNIDPSTVDLTSIPEFMDQIDAINDTLAQEVSANSGQWQSLVARFETALNGTAQYGGGAASQDKLTWTGTCPTPSANKSEINIDQCVRPQDWLASNYPSETWPGSVANFMAQYGAEFYASFDYDAWVDASIPGDNTLDGLAGGLGELLNIDLTGVETTVDIDLGTIDVYNLDRDRIQGFVKASENISLGESSASQTIDVLDKAVDLLDFGATLNVDLDFYQWDPDSGTITNPSSVTSSFPKTLTNYKTGCNPALLSGLPNNLNTAQFQLSIIGVAHALCQQFIDADLELTVKGNIVVTTNDQVRYPSLYYLFPMAAHHHQGSFVADGNGYTSVSTAASTAGISEADQTATGTGDTYPTNSYIVSAGVNGAGATGVQYRPVEDGLGNCTTVACTTTGSERDGVVNEDDDEDISKFVTYLGMAPRTPSSWSTPVSDTATGRVNTIIYNGTPYYPAFLDVGIFNGREQMGTRVLSIDLDLMRQRRVGLGGDATTFCSDNDPDSAAEKTGANKDQNGLCWLPLPTLLEESGSNTLTGALIYAFREDAVREDAIARPTRADASGLTCATDGATWTTAATAYVNATADSSPANGKADALETNGSGLDAADFLMDAVGTNGTNYYDPPRNPCTGVSPKPVDFYTDPDRRPHGFVLRNGKDLRRKTGATTYDTEQRPFTFVTDNLAYIWGDFNLHSTTGAVQNLEEFGAVSTTVGTGDKLDADWSDFYDRVTLNNDFADAEDNDGDGVIDSWRVAEIVADGVTVLSNSFRAGFIAQGLMWDQDNGTTGTGYSQRNSYGGMHILKTEADPASGTEDSSDANASTTYRNNWVLENGSLSTTYPNALASPIRISREGFPIYDSSGTQLKFGAAQYVASPLSGRPEFIELPIGQTTSNNKQRRIQNASETTANLLMISGINPSRAYHGYGGLHNFIRLIENWGGDKLNFSGSLVQLSFSKYSGPFSINAWEAGTVRSNSTGLDDYYGAANRNFGYDVALAYAPAGSVAARLSAPSRDRSEFYRELAIDDPYIESLLCARPDTDEDGTVDDADDTRIDPRRSGQATCQ